MCDVGSLSSPLPQVTVLRRLVANEMNRDLGNPVLNLHMAVRAQQNALASLCPGGLERARRTLSAECKELLLAVPVMKLERGDTSVISTNKAGSSALFHEDPLDPAPRFRNRIAPAALATHSA
jgi:hypothetical protein